MRVVPLNHLNLPAFCAYCLAHRLEHDESYLHPENLTGEELLEKHAMLCYELPLSRTGRTHSNLKDGRAAYCRTLPAIAFEVLFNDRRKAKGLSE